MARLKKISSPIKVTLASDALMKTVKDAFDCFQMGEQTNKFLTRVKQVGAYVLGTEDPNGTATTKAILKVGAMAVDNRLDRIIQVPTVTEGTFFFALGIPALRTWCKEQMIDVPDPVIPAGE